MGLASTDGRTSRVGIDPRGWFVRISIRWDQIEQFLLRFVLVVGRMVVVVVVVVGSSRIGLKVGLKIGFGVDIMRQQE